MLLLHHAIGDPELGARLVLDELRSPDLIVDRTVREGGRDDEAIEEAVTKRHVGWSQVRFVSSGPVFVRGGTHGVIVSAGEGFCSPTVGGSPMRSLTTSSESLSFAWRSGSTAGAAASGAGVLRFSTSARESLFCLGRAMAARPPAGVRAELLDAVAALRAAGVPLAADLPYPKVSPASHVFARALEQVVFPLSSRPMAVDLARVLGVGERQALRRANAHFGRFHVSVATWRDYIHALRVGLGGFFMGQPRARTEHVSRLVGFSSSTSFCHAFQEAGLPSPLSVQRELLAS